MSSIDADIHALENLVGKNRYEVMTEVAAIITANLELYGIMPVVVGGLAVEIYTRGQYTTLDIDLVSQGRDLASAVFARLGFLKEGRHWYHPQLLVAVEIPGEVLEEADWEKVIKIHLPSGRYLYIIGIEDIILDRLRACVHWQSSSDCEWGLRMMKVHYPSLDINYMLDKAKKDHDFTLIKLEEWLRETT